MCYQDTIIQAYMNPGRVPSPEARAAEEEAAAVVTAAASSLVLLLLCFTF